MGYSATAVRPRRCLSKPLIALCLISTCVFLDASFVPGGSGPQGYTSAFSAGDWLIVVKDNMRITAVSLSKGEERLHVTRREPSVSGMSDLLAVPDEGGRLSVYELKTGNRHDAYPFPTEVAHTRFSADGKGLLLLT